MNSREKGNRAEREAYGLLQEVGYAPYKPDNSAFGENDMWSLFDIMAIAPDLPFRAVQVKSNRATGRYSWFDRASLWARHGILTEMWVKHDREGWRVIQPAQEGTQTAYDERKDPKVGHRSDDLSIGNGLVAWLRDSS